MAWRTSDFRGMRPRIASHLLPDSHAQDARNAWLTSGALTPLRDAVRRETIALQEADPDPVTPTPVDLAAPDGPATPDPGPPGAPSKPGIPSLFLGANDSVSVSWQAGTGVTDTNIRYRTKARTTTDGSVSLAPEQPGEWIEWAFSGTGTSTRITGLSNTDIEVAIQFVNGAGDSPWSDPGSVSGGSVLTVAGDATNAVLARHSYGDEITTHIYGQIQVGGTTIREPLSIVHVSQGLAYVASRQASSQARARLYQVNYDGDRITSVTDLGAIENSSNAGPRTPSAMAIDGNDVFVFDRDDGSIYRFQVSGSVDTSTVTNLGADETLAAGEGGVGGIDGMAFIESDRLLMIRRTAGSETFYITHLTADGFSEPGELAGNPTNPDLGGPEGIAHVAAGLAVVVQADGRLWQLTYDSGALLRLVELGRITEGGSPTGMTFIGRPPAAPPAPVVVRESEGVLRETHVRPPSGGRTVTGYERRHRRIGGSWTEAVTIGLVLTSTIDDVEDDEEYEVEVRAISDLGTGPWSPGGRKELPDGIGGPTGAAGAPTVTPGDADEILVTFTASPRVRPRAPVLRYNILYRRVQDSSWTAFTVTGNGTGFRIPDLTTGVDYAVIVQPVNANGVGPWSAEGRGRKGFRRRLTAIETIYRADENWFAFPGDVDVVRGPVVHDVHNRHYWTGEDLPRMTTDDELGAFEKGLPPSRRLGVPAPAAPGVEPPDELSSDTGIQYDAWTLTFVTDLGEEGPPSLPSVLAARALRDNSTLDQVTLHLATEAVGCPQATRKRLYRSAGTIAHPTYRLVADMPIAQTSYVDEKPDAQLGGELVSTEWDPPPAGLKGLRVMANGMGVGFIGRDLYFSEPHQLHAWPRSAALAFPDDIVALGVMGSSVVVLTKGIPHFVSGSTPGSMQQDRIEFPQPCVSKRSVSGFGQTGILYASPDGIMRVSGPGSFDNATAELFAVREWRERNPDEIMGFHRDQAYVAIRGDGAFALDPQFNGLVEYDVGAAAGFAGDNDTLYYVVGNEIFEWDAADGDYLNMRWRTGTRRDSRPMNFGAAQVFADTYPQMLAGGTGYNWSLGAGFSLFRADGSPPTTWAQAQDAALMHIAVIDGAGANQSAAIDAVPIGGLIVLRTSTVAIAWTLTARVPAASGARRDLTLRRVHLPTRPRGAYLAAREQVTMVFDHPAIILKTWALDERNNIHRHTRHVDSKRPFRLPAGFVADEWEFELQGGAEVTEAVVGGMTDVRA